MTPALQEAREIARRRADEYFDALTLEIPFDTAPGGVDLIAAVTEIEEVLSTMKGPRAGAANQRALHAGYLLGVEVGRRLAGGAR